jgi:hypothetical protein
LKLDVASTAPAAGQPYVHLEALAFGTAGYITALPDYIGYGDSGNHFHPYLHAKTLAAAVVNMLKASKTYCATNNIALSGKLFLAGYSEGGYATMAATKEIQENHAAEFTITASALAMLPGRAAPLFPKLIPVLVFSILWPRRWRRSCPAIPPLRLARAPGRGQRLRCHPHPVRG